MGRRGNHPGRLDIANIRGPSPPQRGIISRSLSSGDAILSTGELRHLHGDGSAFRIPQFKGWWKGEGKGCWNGDWWNGRKRKKGKRGKKWGGEKEENKKEDEKGKGE